MKYQQSQMKYRVQGMQISVLQQMSELRSRGNQGERGASLIEYALLLALIAVVCVGAVGFLGSATTGPYSDVQSGFVN